MPRVVVAVAIAVRGCQDHTEQVNVDMVTRKLKLRREEGLAFEELLICVPFSSAISYVISVIT